MKEGFLCFDEETWPLLYTPFPSLLRSPSSVLLAAGLLVPLGLPLSYTLTYVHHHQNTMLNILTSLGTNADTEEGKNAKAGNGLQ